MADAQVDRNPLDEIENADGGVTITLEKPAAGKQDGERRTHERKDEPEPRRGRDDENVNSLRSQLAEANRRTAEAERRAADHEAQRRQAEQSSSTGQMGLIEQSIASTTSEMAALKKEYATAAAAGEFERVADIQERMLAGQIRLSDLTAGKTALQQRREKQPSEHQQQQRRQPSGDPVEDFIAGQNMRGRSADWLREHPECITDPKTYRATMRAHEDAIYEGIKPDTRDYFEFIEDKLGMSNGGRDERDSGGRDDARGRDHRDGGNRRERDRDNLSGNAAPPSRGNGDGRGSSGNTVTLSREEKDFCDESGTDYAAYARNKVKLQREGKMR